MNVLDYLEDIITIDSKQVNINLVVNPGDFQMCYQDPRKIFRFEIFFTIDGEPVEGSEKAIHMATPAEGLFVLYEIRGMNVPWKEINGCLIKVYDADGNVEIHTQLEFHGFKMRPRRCYVVENDNLSRAIVAWHTRPGELEAPEEKAREKPENKEQVPESENEDQEGVVPMPPASNSEISSVEEIMARIMGLQEEEEEEETTMPPP
jgi:hypothetical protein